MHLTFDQIKKCTLVVLLFWQWGCAHTEPSKFYVLNPMTSTGSEEGDLQNGVVIGISPVQFPEYLDRPQIVTRTGGNELNYSEFNRWAEPLKDNFSRILAENLSMLVPNHLYPWKIVGRVDYRIAVEVVHFEGQLGGESTLVARWSLFARDKKDPIVTRKSTFRETSKGQGFEDTVAALNRTLERFSQELAEAVRSLS